MRNDRPAGHRRKHGLPRLRSDVATKDIASYTVHFIPAEEGGYTVEVPALEGCATEGDTFEEAEDFRFRMIARPCSNTSPCPSSPRVYEPTPTKLHPDRI